MQIVLEHNTTNFKQYFSEIKVKNKTPLYRNIELDLTKLVDGDYTLTLLSDTNEILAKEIMRIGDYQIKQYKMEKKYKQYAR